MLLKAGASRFENLLASGFSPLIGDPGHVTIIS